MIKTFLLFEIGNSKLTNSLRFHCKKLITFLYAIYFDQFTNVIISPKGFKLKTTILAFMLSYARYFHAKHNVSNKWLHINDLFNHIT